MPKARPARLSVPSTLRLAAQTLKDYDVLLAPDAGPSSYEDWVATDPDERTFIVAQIQYSHLMLQVSALRASLVMAGQLNELADGLAGDDEPEEDDAADQEDAPSGDEGPSVAELERRRPLAAPPAPPPTLPTNMVEAETTTANAPRSRSRRAPKQPPSGDVIDAEDVKPPGKRGGKGKGQ